MKNTPINKALIYVTLALSFAILGSATPAFADTPIYATCIAIPYNASTGDNVNWQVQNVTGGNGSYTYSWSGTDNLTGIGQTAYKTYTYPGTKTAYVTITSGGQIFNTTCGTNVAASNGYNYNNGYYNNYPYGYNNGNLSVSCYATPSNPGINTSVTWYANATGGNGNYTYSWSGTDGLYGNGTSVYKSYPFSGTKTAAVSVYSNGQTMTQTCSTNVTNNNSYYPYGGSTGAVCSDGTLGTFNGSMYHCNNTGYYNQYSYGQTYVAPTTYTTGYAGTPVAGVFLNQVPSTGIDAKSIKMILFVIGLFAWSLFAAHLIQRKQKTLSVAGIGYLNQSARIEAFKKRNLEKKGSDK